MISRLEKFVAAVSISAVLLVDVVLVAPAILSGCTAPQAAITYKTIYSVEKATVAAYDGYLDALIAGKVKTNSVPAVSRAFNEFQLTVQAAIAVAQFNTNAIAPPEVLAGAAKVTAEISNAK